MLDRLDNLPEAYALMKDVEPSQPSEYILKGVVNATMGQEQNSVKYKCFEFMFKLKIFLKLIHIFKREHLKVAQQYFQLVGGSASECGMILLQSIKLNF